MLKALLISFGSLFLVYFVAAVGMDIVPKLFKRRASKKRPTELHNKTHIANVKVKE